jgi:hypothetical protein
VLTPESVSPGLVYLVSDEAPTRAILNAGAGVFAASHVGLGEPVFIGGGADAADRVAEAWPRISDRAGAIVPRNGMEQSMREVGAAMQARPVG